MIGTRLMGGLGNQMFQYAVARRLAIMKQTEVIMDLQFYENQHPDDTQRSYELGNFVNIKPRFMSPEKRPTEIPYIGKKGYIRYARDFLLRKNWLFYREPSHDYDQNLAYLPNQVYISGFWQSERYFKDVRDHILVDFSFTGNLNKKQIRVRDQIVSSESVSLHVRRGDYVTNPNANKVHGTKGVDYYSKSLNTISKLVSNPHVFVISDDLDWCRENINVKFPVTYVDVNSTGYEDMWFMSLCKHNIIANSSFSWWGAWLNKNPDKVVIAPKQWFNDAEEGADRVPPEWIRL